MKFSNCSGAQAQATKEDHKLQLEAHLDELQRLEETKARLLVTTAGNWKRFG